MRLAVALLGLVLLSFALTFIAVYRGTGSAVRAQIQRQLDGEVGAFARTLEATPLSGRPALVALLRSYVANQPVRASSTLYYATIAGNLIATNQPELLVPGGVAEPGEPRSTRQREQQEAAKLLAARPGSAAVAIPDLGPVLLERRAVTVVAHVPVRTSADNDPDRVINRPLRVVVGVGESLRPVADAQRGVARAFLLAGGAVALLAVVGALLIGSRFAAPMRRMAEVARSVDGGDLAPRMSEVGGAPEEVAVLAAAFNHMLDRLTAAFARQRAFVADASHELRTPLTVLRGQLELLLAGGASADELRRVGGLMEAELERIARLIEDLLTVVKGERRELVAATTFAVRPYLEELWEGVAALGSRRFELGELPDGLLRADPDRLAQALRNLIANAVSHTTSPDGRVRLSATPLRRQGEWRLGLAVDDDGPGIPPDQRELVFERFHRVDRGRDRASGGSGLGLAIVKAIVAAHGGSVSAEASLLGGARISIELPGYRPASTRVLSAG